MLFCPVHALCSVTPGHSNIRLTPNWHWPRQIICGDGFIYAGVYDGHGGAQTSRYLREAGWAKFEQFLQKTKDPKAAFELVRRAAVAGCRQRLRSSSRAAVCVLQW